MTNAAANAVLNKFASSGTETCFHDRHINPQIYADLNGSNWSIKDYEARGGYQALRKILGQGAAASADGDAVPAGPVSVGTLGRLECVCRLTWELSRREAVGSNDGLGACPYNAPTFEDYKCTGNRLRLRRRMAPWFCWRAAASP